MYRCVSRPCLYYSHCGALNENGPYKFMFEYLVPVCSYWRTLLGVGVGLEVSNVFAIPSVSLCLLLVDQDLSS